MSVQVVSQVMFLNRGFPFHDYFCLLTLLKEFNMASYRKVVHAGVIYSMK